MEDNPGSLRNWVEMESKSVDVTTEPHFYILSYVDDVVDVVEHYFKKGKLHGDPNVSSMTAEVFVCLVPDLVPRTVPSTW